MEWTDGSGEPNWLETERECTVDQEGNVCKNTGHVTDYSSEDTDKAPPLQAHTLREFEQHLNDLKKENFSLKLRIYFLEERIQQKYEDNGDDVYRTNIELKVEVESLKQELQEKQHLLDKALTTAESLTNHNEAELQRRCEERQREIDHMQQVLQTKIQLLQEEAQLARNEAERMASLAESCSQHSSVTMETITKEMSVAKSSQPPSLLPDASRDRERLEELIVAVRCKERAIRELTEERSSLRERVTEMEDQLQDLNAALLQKERDAEFYQEELGRERLRVQQEMESLIEDQQSQLSQYECAAGQCVDELQKAQLQVQSLQSKIQESEASNQKLQERLNEMETELHSIRQAAQSQERTIQSLTESLTTKETETQELCQVIEGQNNTMCKLREMAHRSQLQNTQVLAGGEASSLARLQGEVLGLQSSLFCCQLDLESSRRAQRRSQREAADLTRARDRLHGDLDAELQHRETTDRHNQDLRNTVQQLRAELQVKEAELKDGESERHSEISARDKTISELRLTLRDKERLLQEYSEMLEHPADSGRGRDALLDKLKSRIRERDKVLERAIDEKFRCVEEKESEVRRLQLALREKERDLERLRCILSNNEETITSLDTLVRGKELEAEQSQEACRKLQGLKEQSDRNHTVALRERDGIIKQLHTTLKTRSKEAEDLTTALMSKGSPGPGVLLDELSSQLALKERLFQDLLTDRSRQSSEHHTQIQDLLSTISSRDQYIKESGERLRQVITERAGQLQELRAQLSSREQELSEVRREREREREGGVPLATEMERLQTILREKETLIQDLMQSQEEVMVTTRPLAAAPGLDESNTELELQAVKEELQIALKKQKEAERELSELGPALLRRREAHPGTEYQSTLEQLASEYQHLNQALRAEKNLYQNLCQIQSGADSVEKTQALHMELDTVQALRGQLEEVLSRTRDTALALDRAAKAPANYGGFSTDEDDDEDDDGSSSEEFTDSIEEDDVKLTAHSLASIQNAGMSGEPMSKGLSQGAVGVGWQDDAGQKKREEKETREENSQLSQTSCTTRSLNRSSPPRQQVANPEQEQSRAGSRSVPESGSAFRTDGKVSVRCRRREQSDSDGPKPHGPARHNRHMHGQDEEEEEYDDEDEDEEGTRAPRCKRGAPDVTLREGSGKRRCTRPHSLDLGVLLAHGPGDSEQDVGVERQVEGQSGGSSSSGGGGATGFWQHVEAGLREQADRLRSDLALSRQESRDLQERLMVSEATVHAQAEQLKDYRDLLTESAVQRDSKQVQVDLQDLGYETSGRSENEAEREDASSPEFDDLEMCTSLSREHYGDGGGGGPGKPWAWHGSGGGNSGDAGQPDDASSLHCLVQDLRAQLSRCHRVIRGLQLRVRSLSATSDYASSLERTPRKVNWAFQVSPSPSAMEEDEGWQSDGPVRGPVRPNRELQELVSRVALLEEQVRSARLEGKGGAEEGKSATWPGKYNTLIQAQARELSHLRQRMREGRGICHILTQHLGDTTKAFEELLRANDIDYYMGQSFREQLSQSTSLAQRISIKISGRDRSELQDDKMGHELLALRLSKELQEKDKIIESLHTKLQRPPDTPTSSRPPSETTDQSDRTSFVSDDRGSTNEDLDLCSDVDAISEYAQQDPAPRPDDADRPSLFHVPGYIQPPIAPYRPTEGKTGLCSAQMSSFLPLAQNNYWSSSSNTLTFDPLPFTGPDAGLLASGLYHQGLRKPPVRSFSLPHSLSSYALMGPTPTDSARYTPQLSQHSLGHPLKTDGGLVAALTPWGTDDMSEPIRGLAGTPAYQSGNHSDMGLIEEHLQEIRTLRQRLEDSIRTNESLRQQLQGRLATAPSTGAPTNIYIQGLDTVTQLSNEIRVLKEENLSLQSKLQANKDSGKEVEQLQEAVLSGRARLKQAELEAEQWKEELRRLQAHGCEQSQQIQHLRQERLNNQQHSNKLQHEVSLLQQQLSESRHLLHSLQCELQLYDRVCAGYKSAPTGRGPELPYLCGPGVGELAGLLVEVRALRAQLHGQLTAVGAGLGAEPRPTSLVPASPLRDALYRRQLLHDPSPSPPVRDVGPFPAGPPYSPYSELEEISLTANDSLETHAELEGEAPDGSFANRNGRHVVGHVDDFSALQQQVLEGRGLVQRMEATLQTCLHTATMEVDAGQALDYASMRSLLANTKTLGQILEEAVSLLKMFWRAALPSSDAAAHLLQKEQSMREEIRSLRLKLAEQEEVLQSTIQRLRSTNRSKESMETFIVNQLSRTRDVLKKARANLEKNELRISSLSSSSSSSRHGKVPNAAYPKSPDWVGVTPEVAAGGVGRRLAAKQDKECLLKTTS